jgi:maltoporin
MLTTFHPYSPQTGLVLPSFINSGEVGGQIDAFYNFRRGTALGGKRGMRVHANFSTYYALANDNLLFRDFSFDVEKQWTKKFKSILLYSLQQYNDSYGAEADYMTQNIVVADLLYKWTPTFSTKLELQYLQTKQDKKDWMAALLEVNFAPHWSIYASDMFNHGSTKVHYYNAGVSYNKSRTRVALAYGRYKSGFICSGGVCRRIPAYTGASVTVTTSF